MKITKILTILALLLLITSCSDDDSLPVDENARAQDLIGTWNLTEITQEGIVTTEIEGIPIQSNFTSFGKDINAQVTFSENPNNFTSSGSYTSVVTITLLGQANTQEITVPIDDFLNQGSWSLNNGVLKVVQNGESQDANVIELNSNTLKLEIEIEQVIVEQGLTSTANTKANMTLTK